MIFLRFNEVKSVNLVIVPCGMMFWLMLLIAAIERVSVMWVRDILRPFKPVNALPVAVNFP